MKRLTKLKKSARDTLKSVDFFSKISILRDFLRHVEAKRYAKASTTSRRFASTWLARTIY